MFEIGRICVKIAGRDAGSRCVVVDVIDKNTVLIDGQARRRKCSMKHLEPLDKTISIAKDAPFSEIKDMFKKEFDIELAEKKPKKAADRPKKQRAKKEKPEPKEKAKASPKKQAKKTEEKDKEPVKKAAAKKESADSN